MSNSQYARDLDNIPSMRTRRSPHCDDRKGQKPSVILTSIASTGYLQLSCVSFTKDFDHVPR